MKKKMFRLIENIAGCLCVAAVFWLMFMCLVYSA